MTLRELQTARPVGGPRRSRSSLPARHAPQVGWRKREERGGRGRAGLAGQRKARASGRSPAFLSLVPHFFLFSYQRNDAQTRTSVRTPPGGWTCGHPNHSNTATLGRAPWVEGTARTGRRGSARTWGGRCGGGRPAAVCTWAAGQGSASAERRTLLGAGPGPSGWRRVPAGRLRTVAAAGRAAGRPFPRCAPGGAGFACSWPPPPREWDRREG